MKFNDIIKNTIDNKLESYHNIAFDLDDTLIGDNDLKYFFWDYIKNNKNKKYYIVTFRTRQNASTMWEEIKKESNNIISEKNFVHHDLFMDKKIHEDKKKFKLWKGETCYKLNCEVLIDDLEDYVLPGCKKYRIDFFNSQTLIVKKF